MPRKKKEELTPPPSDPAEEMPAPEPSPPPSAPAEETPAPEPSPPVEPGPMPVEAAPRPAGPTQEERRMAAVAHGSILLNLVSGGLFGPLVALVLWLLYDRKSAYISWHALQALVFQVISLLLLLVLGGIAALLWAVTAVLLNVVVGFCLIPMVLGFSTITAALAVGSLVYGCVGALAVLDGRDFRYRWVADWIPSLQRP